MNKLMEKVLKTVGFTKVNGKWIIRVENEVTDVEYIAILEVSTVCYKDDRVMVVPNEEDEADIDMSEAFELSEFILMIGKED